MTALDGDILPPRRRRRSVLARNAFGEHAAAAVSSPAGNAAKAVFPDFSIDQPSGREGCSLLPNGGFAKVKGVPDRNVVNRPAADLILDLLRERGLAKPYGDGSFDTKHLPRTGDVIDALGRPRDNVSYASVSRSLARLQAKGLIVAYRGLWSVGQGHRWGIVP